MWDIFHCLADDNSDLYIYHYCYHALAWRFKRQEKIYCRVTVRTFFHKISGDGGSSVGDKAGFGKAVVKCVSDHHCVYMFCECGVCRE